MSTSPTTQEPAEHDATGTNPTDDQPAQAAAGTAGGAERAETETPATIEPGTTAETALQALESEREDDAAEDEDVAHDDAATASESGALAARTGRSGRRADLEHEGEVAADFLEQLLDIADLDGDLEVNVEGDRAAVSIVDSEDGPAPTRLVGRDGAVLEALQELTRLAVQAETGDRSRLMLDVAGHRAGRRAELVELARRTAESVKESGERAELEPMSAFERKVVHDEVLAAGLVSESEGTEPNRYVVVLPSK